MPDEGGGGEGVGEGAGSGGVGGHCEVKGGEGFRDEVVAGFFNKWCQCRRLSFELDVRVNIPSGDTFFGIQPLIPVREHVSWPPIRCVLSHSLSI